MTLRTELLNQFLEVLYGEASLRFPASRLSSLEMQLRERIKARGLGSFDDYFAYLKKNPFELSVLIDKVTTKETYFFRRAGQFEVLQDEILPKMEKDLSDEYQREIDKLGGMGKSKLPFRVWSAGCATGEEPYTIAMTILEGLRFPRAWDLQVLATDISREAVTRAGYGCYQVSAVNRVPEAYKKKYLTVFGDKVVISCDLMKMVLFRVFNLRNLPSVGEKYCSLIGVDGTRESVNLTERFQVIFCRNVMIYFDHSDQQKLVDNLYTCLKPGGYLFTGDAELLHMYRHHFKTVEKNGIFFYYKPLD